ncbi:MAG: hypothetical protein IPI30_23460 [Saprospiraceae bacterium]|nr:hypothetical protein [Candidatus Vicinibacter affinis]
MRTMDKTELRIIVPAVMEKTSSWMFPLETVAIDAETGVKGFPITEKGRN